MKKILLAIVLSATAYGAGAVVPLFPEASPQAPQTLTAPTLQGEQQQGVVALSDAAATDFTQPVKMPATAMKTPERKAAEHQWGEWYTFKTGTLSSVYPYTYSSLFNIELPVEVKLLRRDATDDKDASQLRFEGFLDESGIVYDWDNASGLIQWDAVDIAGFENTHEAGVPITFRQYTGSYYYPKTELKINAFVSVMSNQAGFYGILTFTPDDLPDCAIDFTVTATDPEAGEVEVSFNTVGSDVAEIRYGLIYANSINYTVPEFSRVYAYGTLFDIKTVVKNNFSDFDITSLPGKSGVTRKHTVDRSGRWAVGALLFDKDEDILGFYVKDIRIGLSEDEKWEDAGMATFTDGNFSNRFENARSDLSFGVYTSITLPEWADADLTWEVPMQKSKTTPGLYRLVNPYTCEGSPCSDAVMHFETATESYDRPISFDRSHDYYYIFDIQKTDRPWAYVTPTGVWFNYGEDLLPGMDSTNQNREPEDYSSFSELRYEGGGRITATYNDFEILLPGYNDYNVTFGTTTKELYIESLGANVAKVKYTVLPRSADNQNIYARIDADDEALVIATATQPGVLDLSAFGVEPEGDFYMIYAVTYDAAGAEHVNKRHSFMLYKHEYKFYSRAELREVILEERLGYVSDFHEVDVYTADDAEGHFFILDPYYSLPAFHYSIDHTGSYMDIDCSDPDHVNIPEYTVPADLGYGKMAVQSLSNYFMTVTGYSFEEVAEAGWFGTYRNGLIKLPIKGGVVHLDQGDRYLQSCALTTFCLRFPGYVDYSFELEASDNKILVTKVENGVARIKFSVAEVGTISHADLMAAMQSGEAEMYDLGESNEIDLRALQTLSGRCSVVGRRRHVARVQIHGASSRDRVQICRPGHVRRCHSPAGVRLRRCGRD